MVSRSPLHTLWGLHGTAISVIAKRTWRSVFADNLLGRAAELGFYFLFALFPTLFSASSILGLIARSASHIYEDLLGYLSLVMPMEALGSVMKIFSETTEASGSGKITFGLIATIWSASVGISAIQDTLKRDL
jgi:membrane protein